jgi:predicted nucleic acid-binding protein
VDAFDADVLICAAQPDHAFGARVLQLFADAPSDALVGVGSVVLLPEVLSKSIRDANDAERLLLEDLLSRLGLQDLDREVAQVATDLAAKHRLQAADAAHLATAVVVGADRFITNNQRDFPQTIEEIDVVYPADLPDPDEETDHG